MEAKLDAEAEITLEKGALVIRPATLPEKKIVDRVINACYYDEGFKNRNSPYDNLIREDYGTIHSTYRATARAYN